MLSFGGFQPSQASTSFHNSQQPPKSSTMLGLGGFRPLQASTSFHDPRQPPKLSTMLSFGSTSLDNPRNRARCSVWGVFNLPGLQPPSMTLNNPRNRALMM